MLAGIGRCRWQECDVRKKQVFTTGEAAVVCKLSQQTIIRCFDNGQVQGFRVPGSRFRRIPRDALIKFMQANNIPMDALEAAENGKIRVLVVDDEPSIVELFADVLKADGRFDVATASTGYNAGVLTEQFQPDVIVLDYMLPDINGNVVCRTIRQNPDLAGIKILIISGMVKPDEVEELMKAGANDFIKKPFNIEQVVDRLVELANK